MSVISKIVGAFTNTRETVQEIATKVLAIVGDPHKPTGDKLAEIQGIVTNAQVDIARIQGDVTVETEQSWASSQAEAEKTMRARLKSNDAFVRRARPSWMYGLLAIYVGRYLVIDPVWSACEWPIAEIPMTMHAITTTLVGGYGVLRSREKKSNVDEITQLMNTIGGTP